MSLPSEDAPLTLGATRPHTVGYTGRCDREERVIEWGRTFGVVISPRPHACPLATQDCYSRKATMGRELMAPRTDRTTRIPSGVASPVTTHHAAKGSVFVSLRNGGNLKIGPQRTLLLQPNQRRETAERRNRLSISHSAHVRQSRPDSGLHLKAKVLDRLRVRPLTRGTSLGGVPREQKMLKGHLPRVKYHQVY